MPAHHSIHHWVLCAACLLCSNAVLSVEARFWPLWQHKAAQTWTSRKLHQLTQLTPSNISGDAASQAVFRAWQWNVYHNYTQMESFLKALAYQYNDTCQLSSAGKSAQGLELYVLIITSNITSNTSAMSINQTFTKPVMTYIGNMHGDEDINREMLLQLCLELCSSSSVPVGSGSTDAARLRALLDNTILHIIPCLNPDSAFATPPTRNNANGIDLNRNAWTFDFPYDKPLIDTPGVSNSTAAETFLLYGGSSPEPETRAVTSWLRAHPPRLSANLHGGALVASYLLDACDTLGIETVCLTIHGSLPRFLANAYSAKMPEMRNSSEFVNGTTRGAAWYPALGTLQDWVFWTLGQMHVTLELHEFKTLQGSPEDYINTELPKYYPKNREALLRLAELSHMGLRARVVDAVTGAPLSLNVSQVLPLVVQYPPVSQAGQELSVMMTPGLEYALDLQPYDVCQSDTRYPVVQLRAAVPLSWDGALNGTGITNLTLFREIRVAALPPSTPPPLMSSPATASASPSPSVSD